MDYILHNCWYLIHVKLTDHGYDILFSKDPAMATAPTYRNATNNHTFFLWQFMNIFGDAILNNGVDQLFIDNHIIIEVEIKKKSRPDIILREQEFKAFYKAYPKKKAPGHAENKFCLW